MHSHRPRNMSSRSTTIAIVISVNAIAIVATKSEEACADPFSLWGVVSVLPEVLGPPECITVPCRREWAVTAIDPWGSKGELTILDSKGLLFYLFYCFSSLCSYSTN